MASTVFSQGTARATAAMPNTCLQAPQAASRSHVVSLGLHVDGALADIDLEAAVVAQTAADVAHQLVLKGPAVEALQDDLAQLEQENLLLVHKSSSEYAKSRKYLRMILHSILHLSSEKKP